MPTVKIAFTAAPPRANRHWTRDEESLAAAGLMRNVAEVDRLEAQADRWGGLVGALLVMVVIGLVWLGLSL